MEPLKIGHGPWTMIFKGTWTGHEIHFYENPDRMTLTAVFEKEKNKVVGALLILDKYFVVTGNVEKLIEKVGQHTQVINKHYPSFKAKYLVVSSGPIYTKIVKAEEELDKAFAEIGEGTETVNSLSRRYSVDLTELKNAKPEYADRLFSEPLLLPVVMTRRGTPAAGASPRASGFARISFGKSSADKAVEEDINGYFNTLIIGNAEQVKQGMQLLIENCALNKVPALVFDDRNAFEEISAPNRKFDFKGWPDIQPVGMPLKNPELSRIGISLNMLDSLCMKEIVGIHGDEGSMAFSLIKEILEKNKGRLMSLDDMGKKIMEIRNTGKKFQMMRAVRLLKVLEMSYPNIFKDKTNTRALVSAQIGGMGAVTRLNTSGLPQPVRNAFIYSALQSVHDEFGKGVEMRMMACILDGEHATPKNVKTQLQEKIVDILSKCNETGIAFCISTEHKIDVNNDLTEHNTAEIDFIGDKEIAIKKESKKPYRVKLRPTLSA